ncbi:MAG: translation elongation factor-like protein [Thermodesulfovibrionia bacterium]|nr:translation elongation factor-like protein [Thermodesulfovibrionia bacterium]
MEILAGKITHYYKSIGVAAVDVSNELEIGNIIHIKGHTTDFEQKIETMQIEHKQITKAEKGQVVGINVKDYVREHDLVYRIEKE